jgi:hypothetical protein
MNLITDRTLEDVLNHTQIGRYEAADLNRVEAAVQYLAFIAQTIVPVEQLVTKTNWKPPEQFSSDTWITQEQMERYLSNVKSLCESVGIDADLPLTMEGLTWQGANQIEKALQRVQEYVSRNYKGFQYSGDLFAGEENGL